jgi:predicted MPP superfamily phosphohydrolase
MKKRILIISLSVIAVLLLTFVIWMLWGNFAVTVSEYSIKSESLPAGFDGFRIAQVSDLHNDELGEGNSRLIAKIKEADPDIIVITGDLIDRNRTDIDVAVEFAEKSASIAPTYYISGNHEAALSEKEYADLCARLMAVGVTVLENDAALIERNGEYISLVGLRDQGFNDILSNEELIDLKHEKTEFSVLLAHRPRDFDQYAACGYDLVFSGHLHGGQFQIPFLGGLYAPSYGLFPEYDGGVYEKEGSIMVVSRGVGNSRFPVRFNNPREIVVVELVKK